MELKKGMYVRYTRGAVNGYVPPRIAKIVDCSDSVIIKLDNNQIIINNDVKKASHNIIDLIEVGDYVNGQRVGYIDDLDGAMREYYYDYEKPNKDTGHFFEEIHSVLTKEQFEQCIYVVRSDKYDI